jgi:predicted DNA-binding protein with PD1-like motif
MVLGTEDFLVKNKQLDGSMVLIFETGEEVVSTLTKFAKDHQITAAHFTAIGAFSDSVIGYFDWQKKDYLKNPVKEQVEVVSLAGDIAIDKDQPKVHAHVVLGKRDGSAVGGHLLQAHVRPTLELVLDSSAERLERRFDPDSGLALIAL